MKKYILISFFTGSICTILVIFVFIPFCGSQFEGYLIRFISSQLFKIIIGTFIGGIVAVMGSLLIFTLRLKEERRRNHFEKLKQEVFVPLKSTKELKRDFTIITEILFHDLKNHFPKLLEQEGQLRELENEKNNLLFEFKKTIQSSYENINIDNSIEFIIIFPDSDRFEPKIDGHNIVTDRYICATIKQEVTGQKTNELIKLHNRLLKLANEKESMPIKDLYDKILRKRLEIEKIIDEILSSERLPGECQFIR